jgi:hypothetical protein
MSEAPIRCPFVEKHHCMKIYNKPFEGRDSLRSLPRLLINIFTQVTIVLEIVLGFSYSIMFCIMTLLLEQNLHIQDVFYNI